MKSAHVRIAACNRQHVRIHKDIVVSQLKRSSKTCSSCSSSGLWKTLGGTNNQCPPSPHRCLWYALRTDCQWIHEELTRQALTSPAGVEVFQRACYVFCAHTSLCSLRSGSGCTRSRRVRHACCHDMGCSEGSPSSCKTLRPVLRTRLQLADAISSTHYDTRHQDALCMHARPSNRHHEYKFVSPDRKKG